VECLEQIRLPHPVCADHQYEPRLEGKVESGVRAEAPERCPGDDQPASLIGMIR
jgi:hypothetical protein